MSQQNNNSKTLDADTLRKFYFSNSSSFGPFQQAQERKSKLNSSKQAPSPMRDPATPGAADHSVVSPSQVSVNMPSTIDGTTAATPAPSAQKAAKSPTQTGDVVATLPPSVGLQGLRSMMKPTPSSTKKSSMGPKPDAASPEYFEFLKQQQELQNQHARIEETISQLEDNRRERQAALVKLRRQSAELMKTVEDSTDWKLRSRYDVGALGRDCSLSLQPVELVDEKPAQYLGVQQLQANLNRIRESHQKKEAFKDHALFVDQGTRRLGLLEKLLAESNVDTTDISRIPDSLIIHLDKVLALPTIESVVAPAEEQLDKAMFRTEEARKAREAAIADGEVHVAEKICYDIIDEHEKMLAEVLRKIRDVDSTMQETIVMEDVRSNLFSKTHPEFEVIKVRAEKLKVRCEEDIKKMFALREKVEEVETQAAKKVVAERQKSDVVLTENAKKLEAVFAKMEELEREVEVLERERHREIQKRIAEKDKDEHRRSEFEQFCAVVDAHLIPLERTIKNMDIVTHADDVVHDFVNSGFKSMEEELVERKALLKEVAVETHKQHVEVFRGLLLEIGEVIYKKERMIEETDRNIEQAHIQQELLAETFNPNAKKFGDIKKRLQANREELECDIRELKERAQKAVEEFAISEEALAAQGIEYVHPVTEQEQHALAMRARMMEIKAISAGHVEGQQVLHEISSLKEQLNASRAEMESMNQATSGTMSKTLPMIRAAQKARVKNQQ